MLGFTTPVGFAALGAGEENLEATERTPLLPLPNVFVVLVVGLETELAPTFVAVLETGLEKDGVAGFGVDETVALLVGVPHFVQNFPATLAPVAPHLEHDLPTVEAAGFGAAPVRGVPHLVQKRPPEQKALQEGH